jgi:arylsulfatase A-like enzyme
LTLLWMPRIPVFAARSGEGPPHIVILGIDALRNDLTIPRRGPAQAPNIRGFISEARRFDDTLTPLARTYPSWTTILTGRHPVTTNARFNLMPRRLVHEGDTLATALRTRGYRATYATDEVRYANFNETYGFDQIITPPIGAIDFLLGYGADMPLVNLVASTPIGGLLFPSNHANRAASVTYRPRDFVERLEREIDVNGPAFIAIHLTLAHWPYSWAGRSTPTTPPAYRVAYGEAVPEVDRQFADVLAMLARKGVLDNAVVVLLSDHGEALGAENDSIIRQTGSSQEIWDTLWGHGTSVLSPNQYHVLLAMRAFGRARLPGPERNYDWPVSLEDVRPTLEELATGIAATDVDGLSLVPLYEGSEACGHARDPYPLHRDGPQHREHSRRALRCLGRGQGGRALLRARSRLGLGAVAGAVAECPDFPETARRDIVPLAARGHACGSGPGRPLSLCRSAAPRSGGRGR